MHRLTRHHTGSLELECTAALDLLDLAEPVDRLAERVDHAAEVALAHGHREHLAGAGDLLALLDAGELAEHDDTDLVLLEVLRQAERAVREADQLVRHHAGETLDVGDAIGCVDNSADLGLLRLGRLVRRREVLQRVADFVRAD